jgi:hypothetical protein
MHIHKTDMDLDLARTPRKLPSYELYYRWVEKQPKYESIYLMTDNAVSQKLFQKKYNTDNYMYNKRFAEERCTYIHIFIMKAVATIKILI